ncbi:serine/threonine protein kinase [Thermogemmatispora onikobensis]|uniref:serine/threonine protein kinase n=1 Tax=Thermogemmatispora onikobensis TaxID=732234 RepID=UPI0008529F7E|nr:serine/threonine protein kinase [Thermogemmatispora onikobensis]
MTTAGEAGTPDAYRLSRLLGKTSLAETYLGEERASGTPIVFKRLTLPLNEGDRQRLLAMLQASARILHPALVRVRAVGLHDNAPFAVTEYAPAGSLRQRYPRGIRLRPEILLSFLPQLGSALQHLHRQGVFHLDLKPENILLKADGNVMLSDAGWLSVPALLQVRLTAEPHSAAYLAPEQLLGLPVAASDQYALACLLYDWLSGQPPFVGSPRDVCRQHLYAPPPPLATSVPAALTMVLWRALEKDPGKRFPSVTAFVEAYTQALRGTASRPASTSVSSKESSPSHTPSAPPPAPSELVLHQQEGRREEETGQPPSCRLCGRPLPTSSRPLACPVCGYPADLQEEQRFLEQLTSELSRLAHAGAASLPLGVLAAFSVPSLLALRREAHAGHASLPLGLAVDRYWHRLMEVRRLLATASERARLSQPASPSPSLQQRTQGEATFPTASSQQTSAATPVKPASQQQIRQELPDSAAPSPAPSQRESQSAPAAPVDSQPQVVAAAREAAGVGPTPAPAPVPSAPPPPLPSRPSPIATLRPLVESPVALMVALGTFLLLAALVVFHIADQSHALPVTICAQGFFALMMIITGRSYRFHEFRGIYAIFFALTVPLLFPDLEPFLQHYQPWLLALTALYAAVTYGVLAVSQRFAPFAILCAVALVVSTVSLVGAVFGSQGWLWIRWVPAGLLALALVEAEALGAPPQGARGSPLARLLYSSWDVLRLPLAFSSQTLAYTITGLAFIGSPILLILLWTSTPVEETLRVATSAPVTLLLASVWLLRLGALTRQSPAQYPLMGLLTLAVLLTASLIAPEAARLMSSLGLLLLATCSEGYARLAPPSLWLYLRPGRELTTVRFLLLLLLPFLAVLPAQATGQTNGLLTGSSLVFASAALLLLVVLWPAPEASPGDNRRLSTDRSPWLLLLPAGMLLWGYAALGQALNWASVGPLWWFGLFCGAFLALSSLIRRLAGRQQAALWEIVALAAAILILVLLPLQQDLLAMALVPLLLGTASYGLLIVQRRSLWLFLPGLFLGVGLLLLGFWIRHLQGNDAWAVVLLGSAVLLPPLAATLRRWLPAGQTNLVQSAAQTWTSERLLTTWEWDWPLTALALGAGCWLASLLLGNAAYWSRMALAMTSGWPWLAGLAQSGWLAVEETLIVALVSYLAGLWARSRLWLVPAALFALIALWLVQDQFWALTGVVVGTAAVGLVVSRLSGQRWAVPWYVAALFSLLLVMRHALLPSIQAESTYVLLGLAGVVTVVGLMEGQPKVLWLVPLLLLEASAVALLYRQLWLLDVLLVPALVPLSALVGLGVSRWDRLRQGPPSRAQRWRWSLPWYVGGLVGLGATSLVAFGGPWKANPLQILWLVGPYLLLSFAVLATAVAWLERTPELLWLAPVLVLEASTSALKNLWAATLAQPQQATPGLLLPLLVPACALVGLLLSRLHRHQRLLRLRWAAPWYVGALVGIAASSLALFTGRWAVHLPILAQVGPYLLLGFAGLATAVGLVEALPEVLWLVPLLTVLAIAAAQLTTGSDRGRALLPPGLVLLSTLVALGTSRAVRGRLRQRSADAAVLPTWFRLRLTAPWYLTATFAACATATFPFVQRGMPWPGAVPILLLGYALLAFLAALQEQWLWLSLATVVFGLWGLRLLIGRVPDLLLPLGVGALAVAFLADVLLHPLPSRAWPASLVKLIRPSWALVWVPLIVLTWSALGWLRPQPVAFLLTLFPTPAFWGAALVAFLVYGSGLLLRQLLVCWLALPLALSALAQVSVASEHGQPGPGMSELALFCLLCTLGLAIGASLERRWPLRPYLLPLLASNCAGVLMLGMAGTTAHSAQGLVLASALLLGYGFLSWLLALHLGLPWLTLLTGLWTIWGLALLALNGQLDQRGKMLLVIPIGAAATLLGLLGLHRSTSSAPPRRHQPPDARPQPHEEEPL